MSRTNEILDQAYLGKRVHDLTTTLTSQLAAVYHSRGITVPVESSSTLQVLAEGRTLSVAEIGRRLDITHQLASQRIEKLRKRDLVSKRRDEEDGRIILWGLTESGRDQAERLTACMLDAIRVHDTLFAEMGINLLVALDAAQTALAKAPLAQRFEALYAQRQAV